MLASPRTLARDRRANARRAYFLPAQQRHDVTEIACREVGVLFAPVRLGYDCREQADSATLSGEPVQHCIMENWEARVHPLAMA